ncbi:MAG TPA: BrnT family toxin [Stellaceae bacterium]|nr:BrnT family toxin [Stellaceae bacterium]
MKITFDPAKREWTLRERSLDFRDASKIFAGPRLTFEDTRFGYSERRYITVGLLNGRMMILVWTPREKIDDEECRHIISMRKANVREQARYIQRLGED